MIPKNITREHVIKAIEEIETSGFLAARTSRKFLLKYNGKDYPPKYVLSIANKYANGKELTPNDLSGGRETNGFLQNLRFEIECKTTGEKISYAVPMRKEREISVRKGHSERCGECKGSLGRVLIFFLNNRQIQTNYSKTSASSIRKLALSSYSIVHRAKRIALFLKEGYSIFVLDSHFNSR